MAHLLIKQVWKGSEGMSTENKTENKGSAVEVYKEITSDGVNVDDDIEFDTEAEESVDDDIDFAEETEDSADSVDGDIDFDSDEDEVDEDDPLHVGKVFNGVANALDNLNSQSTFPKNKKAIFTLLGILAGIILISGIVGLVRGKNGTPDGEPVEDSTITSQEVTEDTLPTIPVDEEIDPYAEFYVNSDRSYWLHFEDAVGQLYIDKLGMSYVVFQAEDNEKYLNINLYGEEDEHGSIFGDYRNNFNNLDENNVIYGHNMADGSMFAGLLKMRDESYFTEESDYYINFNSESYDNIFKIFSVYETDLTSFNYIQTGFDPFTKAEFVNTVKERNENAALSPDEVSADATILTLSTCTQGGTHRLVVQAYLLTRKVV